MLYRRTLHQVYWFIAMVSMMLLIAFPRLVSQVSHQGIHFGQAKVPAGLGCSKVQTKYKNMLRCCTWKSNHDDQWCSTAILRTKLQVDFPWICKHLWEGHTGHSCLLSLCGTVERRNEPFNEPLSNISNLSDKSRLPFCHIDALKCISGLRCARPNRFRGHQNHQITSQTKGQTLATFSWSDGATDRINTCIHSCVAPACPSYV